MVAYHALVAFGAVAHAMGTSRYEDRLLFILGWVHLVTLAFVAACMMTEKGEWSPVRRLLYVPLSSIKHIALSVLLAYPLAFVFFSLFPLHLLLNRADQPETVGITTAVLLSGVIVVYTSLRRSRYLILRSGDNASFERADACTVSG